MSALTGIRVVELAESVAGEYCGKLLADFGAEVIKVEAPGRGSPTRAMAPIVGGDAGDAGREGSALFPYLNTNKQSVVLDPGSAGGAELLHKIIGAADAVIEKAAVKDAAIKDGAGSANDAGSAGSATWSQRHPSVVFCSITPFGKGAAAEFENAKSIN